jgi:hypothetical protein
MQEHSTTQQASYLPPEHPIWSKHGLKPHPKPSINQCNRTVCTAAASNPIAQATSHPRILQRIQNIHNLPPVIKIKQPLIADVTTCQTRQPIKQNPPLSEHNRATILSFGPHNTPHTLPRPTSHSIHASPRTLPVPRLTQTRNAVELSLLHVAAGPSHAPRVWRRTSG